ncbi:DUF3455 domain-containing protein [Mycobacterium sp. AZCC_0083]|uniref:DUF3455 domain-containing protein n=1 Tax=Mycobacterium sp. AZCC_0083 TaxID=2735882 RepID=UPI00161B659D|nr:DUF3455 domain-containing protein [Mycobacterium sp. AZCC_0083]MBB5163190.1 hypothetical protein [Mycobacterium sp. AZCC_0083]
MVRRTLVLAIGSVALGVLGCSPAGQSQVPTATATKEDVGSAGLPPPLVVPAGNRLTSSLDGSGVQVYQCVKGQWTLLQPAAILTEGGKPVGLHFKGPVWVSTVDGSEVGAAPVATVTQSGAIPELLLKANQNQGEGMFSKVTYVQRLRTSGGVAPAGSCPEGSQQAIRYSAVYRFWSAP